MPAKLVWHLPRHPRLSLRVTPFAVEVVQAWAEWYWFIVMVRSWYASIVGVQADRIGGTLVYGACISGSE